MLTINLKATDEFESVTIELEHSLVSLSKWESIHEKPFFNKDGLTPEEALSYTEQMLVTSPAPPNWVDRLTANDRQLISSHIDKKASATWFRETPFQKPSTEVITAELIYYWMITFSIPFEPCESWHLNRLMTLVQVCGIKQSKPKKMSRQAQAEEYRRLNEARRNQLGTSG